MSEILYRAELHHAEQARIALSKGVLPWIGQQLEQGRELVMEVRLLDDDITQKQRGYLHAVVLTEIAHGIVIEGVRHPMAVWKEFLRDKFLGFRVVTAINPLTGRKLRRRARISTEDLGVRGMANYIDQCCAFAAEYGVTISEPLPPELRPQRRRARAIEAGRVDADGVILDEATA